MALNDVLPHVGEVGLAKNCARAFDAAGAFVRAEIMSRSYAAITLNIWSTGFVAAGISTAMKSMPDSTKPLMK